MPVKICMSVCVYSVFLLSCVKVAALRRADLPSKECYRLRRRSMAKVRFNYFQINKNKSMLARNYLIWTTRYVKPISITNTFRRHIVLNKYFFFKLHSGGWSPNWVHSARRPLTGLLYLPWVIVRMENLVEWMKGETEVLGENLPRRHFVHHKSHLTRPGIEPRPPRWEASD
jgi:hypothetical protein